MSANHSRPEDVPPTATFDDNLSLWCDRSAEYERMWSAGGTQLLDAPRRNGKLHGDVMWRLMTDDASQFAPRVAMAHALGLPTGPNGTLIATFADGELTAARFFLRNDEDTLVVSLREGKLDGEMRWKVGSVDGPLFSWRNVVVDAKKTFKIPKPWPKTAVASFAKGKLLKAAFYDAEGQPLDAALGPIADWGENTKPADLPGYIERGAFLADVQRFFPKGKGVAPEELPKKSTKLANLPAAHRASAEAFDALVRKKKLPYMGVAFDVLSYGFDAEANALDGAADAKYFGIANEGSGNMFLLDVTTGEVVVHAHDEGTIAKGKFPSLDAFTFAMLRIELAAAKRIPKPALKKLLASVGLDAVVEPLALLDG